MEYLEVYEDQDGGGGVLRAVHLFICMTRCVRVSVSVANTQRIPA